MGTGGDEGKAEADPSADAQDADADAGQRAVDGDCSREALSSANPIQEDLLGGLDAANPPQFMRRRSGCVARPHQNEATSNREPFSEGNPRQPQPCTK